MLEEQGIKIIEKLAFADHHNYKASEVSNLCSMAQKAGAKLITTKKDFMRLQGLVDQDSMNMIESVEALVDFGHEEIKLKNLLERKIY